MNHIIINEDNTAHYLIVPEFPSLLTLSLSIIATLSAVMLYKKRTSLELKEKKFRNYSITG